MRTLIECIPQIAEQICMPLVGEKAKTLACLLGYGSARPTRWRRRTPMNMDALVIHWTDNLARLCTSHSKEDRDRADFEADELIGPILMAPVAQLREFAVKLGQALKEDERIPFLIWSSFEHWINNDLLKLEASEAVELRTHLALEVAGMAEKGLSGADWVTAIANALKWRPKEDLEAVKAKLEKGVKPKITGRQSCLFLEVDGAMVVL